jgi:type I restriction enzyme, S subunit
MHKKNCECANSWQQRTLGSLARYINGRAFKPADWGTTGLPIIRIEQINNPDGRYDYFNGVVSDYHLVNNGDLLFSWSATLTTLIWTREPAVLNQHIFKVLPRGNTHVHFLHHLLQFLMDDLIGHTHGSTMKHIKRSALLPFRVMVPDPFEQSFIARILDTLDTQIQQTEQLVAKLKQMKAGLLHDLLTQGIDEHGDVRDPVAHPEEFNNSVLGSIPKVWKVGKFEVLANIIDPQPSHRAPAEVVGGEPYVGVGDLREDGSINFESCRKVSLKAVIKQEQRFSIEAGDIIFGKIGTIGFPQFLPQGVRYALNANTVIIKPKYCPSYILWLLRSSLVEKQIQMQIHSTTQPAFGIQRIRAMLVPLPDKNEQHRISLILDAHNARITAEESHLAKLKQLKKGLMHDLLTGRVRVTPLMAESEQLDVPLKSFTDCK